MITVPEHPLHFVGRQQTSGEVDYVMESSVSAWNDPDEKGGNDI